MHDDCYAHVTPAGHPERVDSMKKSILHWKETLPDLPKISPSTGAVKSVPPSRKPGVDRAAAFRKKDLNNDGQLTLAEYLHNFRNRDEVKDRFPRFDKNGDGVLSREEFENP